MNQVAILGSLNMDLMLTIPRLPKIGETIVGQSVKHLAGGKGLNQAVAASRMTSDVVMLGKIGDDTFGHQILQDVRETTLSFEFVLADQNASTGLANVFKLPQDNCITIIPGANGGVDEAYVTSVQEQIKKSDVFLTQLEIPLSAVSLALKIAKKNGVITILNPAPYVSGVAALLADVDILTPNETEFYACLPLDLQNLPIEAAMLAFSEQISCTLIVTRGITGVSFVQDGQVKTISAPKVMALDTTGAGDTFNGVLASAISRGQSLASAIQFATFAASLSVQKIGAQSGMPTLAEVLGDHDSDF